VKVVLVDVRGMFTKVKTCMWPTNLNGMKLPLLLTVSCPEKVTQLVVMLGGEEAVIEQAGDGKLSKALLELAAVPADEMTESGALTRRATGLLQWMSPVRLEVKMPVHVLSRVMKAQSAAAPAALRKSCKRVSHDTAPRARKLARFSTLWAGICLGHARDSCRASAVPWEHRTWRLHTKYSPQYRPDFDPISTRYRPHAHMSHPTRPPPLPPSPPQQTQQTRVSAPAH
jgi:hypothetical protein